MGGSTMVRPSGGFPVANMIRGCPHPSSAGAQVSLVLLTSPLSQAEGEGDLHAMINLFLRLIHHYPYFHVRTAPIL